MQPITYLVQANDGSLYGYDREDILRCHLAENRNDPPRQIFRLSQSSLPIRYDPIDPTELINTQVQLQPDELPIAA